MNERVLYERLQDERRYEQIVCVRRRIDRECQPVIEANLFQLEIAPRECELVPQGNFILLGILEDGSKKLTQPRQTRRNSSIVSTSRQHRYAVQNIEQKMRLNLRAKSRETCFGEARSKLERSDLASRHEVEREPQ